VAVLRTVERDDVQQQDVRIVVRENELRDIGPDDLSCATGPPIVTP
jgi:hypothetical protein